MIDDLSGRRVTVMGLGRFGGGRSVARWLAERGAEVLVTDLAPAAALAHAVAELDDLVASGAVRLKLGGHDGADFTAADLVVANPAVPRPWEDPYLRQAEAAGVPVTTEIRLVVERLDRRRVIGVTGTAGKSTTAAMIHHILVRAAGPGSRPHFGGNIGGSLLPALDRIGPEDPVVLELSSAMLHWLGADVGFAGALPFSPHVAVLTNLAPNHLDWHGSFAHYERSKGNVFAHQRAGDHAVRGDDLAGPGPPIPLRLPAHNQHNARVAAAAAAAAGIEAGDAADLLADFSALPHRLQLVARDGDREIYDDSKSTTPTAAVLAVGSFPCPSKVHLIAGGYDKRIGLGAIAALGPDLAGLYTIGQTGGALAETAGPGAVFCATLERAVICALAAMADDDVLLLSPGCASWDQFDNYEQRGKAFRRAVEETLRAETPKAGS